MFCVFFGVKQAVEEIGWWCLFPWMITRSAKTGYFDSTRAHVWPVGESRPRPVVWVPANIPLLLSTGYYNPGYYGGSLQIKRLAKG